MIVLGTALTFTGDPSSGRAHLLRAAEFSDQLQADPQMRAYLGAGFRLVGEHDRARDILLQLISQCALARTIRSRASSLCAGALSRRRSRQRSMVRGACFA